MEVSRMVATLLRADIYYFSSEGYESPEMCERTVQWLSGIQDSEVEEKVISWLQSDARWIKETRTAILRRRLFWWVGKLKEGY